MVSSTLLEMQRNIEGEYEKRIEEMLAPVVGLGKVRAKVTAEIDPARVNTTEESFDPDKVVVKQNIKNEETNQGSKPNPVGIPGSRSNLPGAEAQNNTTPMATTSSEKVVSNTSYGIPRKVQVTDKPSGNIKRLTVAVVVDGYYKKTEGSPTEVFTPRTEDELHRIQELVGNAVGFDSQRRDSITVNSMAFRVGDIAPTEEVVPKRWWENSDLVNIALRNGFIGLLLMMFFFFIIRPFLRWANVIPKPMPAQEEVEYHSNRGGDGSRNPWLRRRPRYWPRARTSGAGRATGKARTRRAEESDSRAPFGISQKGNSNHSGLDRRIDVGEQGSRGLNP